MGKKKQRHNMGQVVDLPTGNSLDNLAGVISYFAALAYPKAEDSHKAEEFVEVLTTWRLRCCVPYTQHVTIDISQKYSRMRTLRNKISKHFRCLERRLTAASIAWSLHWNRFLAQSVPQSSDFSYRLELPPELGGTVQAHLRRGPTTINKAVQTLADSGMKNPSGLVLAASTGMALRGKSVQTEAAVNIKHRIWAESLPVLHLAIALLQQVEGMFVGNAISQAKTSPKEKAEETPTEDKLLLLLSKTEWLVPTLNYAESLRTFLPTFIPTFLPEKAIRLLPPKSPSQ